MKLNTLVRGGLVVVMVVAFADLFIFGESGFSAYRVLQRDVVRCEARMRKLQRECETLHAEIERWKSDNDLLERAAREQLMLGRDGELVYLLP